MRDITHPINLFYQYKLILQLTFLTNLNRIHNIYKKVHTHHGAVAIVVPLYPFCKRLMTMWLLANDYECDLSYYIY